MAPYRNDDFKPMKFEDGDFVYLEDEYSDTIGTFCEIGDCEYWTTSACNGCSCWACSVHSHYCHECGKWYCDDHLCAHLL